MLEGARYKSQVTECRFKLSVASFQLPVAIIKYNGTLPFAIVLLYLLLVTCRLIPMNPTRLFLVRHGATTATEEGRFSGSSGAELSDQGRWQAARLGDRLSQQHITAVYSSPLSRALETARIIARHCRLEPVIRDGLREIGHGHWEGMKREDVERQFSAEYAAWEADPFTFAPEGGESGVAVLARVLPVIREIVTAHAGGQLLVVSHKATLRLLLSSLLAFDPRGYRDRLDQSPACLNVVDFRDPVRVRLMLFNDTSHYADRPRVADQSLSKWWDQP
jgi:broad specificity phosphatase PhoE